MKSVFGLIEYLQAKKNYLKYKLLFKESKSFIIKTGESIRGFQMISLGDNFYANKYLRIEVIGNNDKIKLIIGNNVSVGRNIHFGVNNKVIIKDGVLLGSNILITDHNHGIYNGLNQDNPLIPPVKRKLSENGFVIINNNVWIGDGVVILPNVEIGAGSIIAANTVVTKDIPENVIAGGNPCKIIKKYNFDLFVWEKI